MSSTNMPETKKDSYGMTYHRTPKPPLECNPTSKKVGKVEDIHGYRDIKDYLKLDTIDLEGGELWEWDDIGFLCGSSGLMVVKDGLVIKSIGLWRS